MYTYTYLLATRNTSSLLGPQFSRLSVAPPSARSRYLALLRPCTWHRARSLLRVKPSRRHAGTRAGRASGADLTHVGWGQVVRACARPRRRVRGRVPLAESRSVSQTFTRSARAKVWLASLAVSSGLGSVRLRTPAATGPLGNWRVQ
jgi:hypothetical protein